MSPLYHNSFYAMGTRCHFVLPGTPKSRADRVFHVVKQEINRIETYLSRFIPFSEITVINKEASKEPVRVSKETFEVLKNCLEFYRHTKGAFDITLRPLMDYWKNRESNDESDMQLYELMDLLGSDKIVLEEAEQTVFLENEHVEIDLGGFGKGYALMRARKLFRDFSIKDAFLSFGESSILTLGSHPAGDHWEIGLKNYTDPGRSIHSFSLNEGSVSTSSNFYVDDDGKLHNHRHVINPYTGYPVEDIVTVSVKADSPVTAEILSTAFLVLSDDVIESILAELPESDVIKINYTSGHPNLTLLTNQQHT